jgi:hypothetical protein
VNVALEHLRHCSDTPATFSHYRREVVKDSSVRVTETFAPVSRQRSPLAGLLIFSQFTDSAVVQKSRDSTLCQSQSATLKVSAEHDNYKNTHHDHATSEPAQQHHNQPSVTTTSQAKEKLDGKDSKTQTDYSGSPPMTSSEGAIMADRQGKDGPPQSFPHPSRQAMISHHSSSVPSTPLQQPRDLQFRSRSRSPSPNAGLGSHSPRSVMSESTSLPTQRKPRTSCRYETNLAFGRRRIPYTIGDEVLPKVKEEELKVALEPHEDDKLTGDMRELYDRLLPSDESEQRRAKLVKKLEDILHKEWPGIEFKVHMFGSSGNLLCTSESDGKKHAVLFTPL